MKINGFEKDLRTLAHFILVNPEMKAWSEVALEIERQLEMIDA